MNFTIRNATADDVERLLEIKNLSGLGFRNPLKEKFLSRLELFPQGFLVAESGKEMIGSSSSQIVDFDYNSLKSWNHATDYGWIKGTHNSNGDSLFVVSIFVSPDISGKGYGSALLDAQKQLAVRLGLKKLMLGSRMPHYHRNSHLSLHDYSNLLNGGNEKADPVLRFYERNGLRMLKAVDGFMQGDKESRECGAVMGLEI